MMFIAIITPQKIQMQLANTDPINQLSTFRFLMDNLHYVVISDYNNRSKADV